MAKKQKSEPTVIDTFENLDVIGATIAVTNAGDGLSQAMEIEGRIIHRNERVYVLLECDCSNVQFPSSKEDPNKLLRKQVLSAGVATIVDAAFALPTIDKQREKNRLADEAKKGITRLPMSSGEESE